MFSSPVMLFKIDLKDSTWIIQHEKNVSTYDPKKEVI